MKIVIVTVSSQGETRLETKGFAGTECRSASEFLKSALGTTSKELLTAEFHQTAAATGAQLRQGLH